MRNDPFWWTRYVTLNPEYLSDYFSQEEATELIDKFKREFPEVKDWADKVKSEATVRPKDTDQFMVDIRYGHHYHYPGCLATVKPSGFIPEDAGYRELSYGEIRALKTHDGGSFEPHDCVGSLGRLRNTTGTVTHVLEQDIAHLRTSGCSECKAIADRLEKTLEQTAVEMAVAMSGRAVRGPNLSDDTYQLVKSIAKWVYANSAIDYTTLLTKNPKPEVSAERLLDYLSSATGISRGKISEWVWSGIGEVDNG